MNLEETAVLMKSNDYKDRLKAEYYQTKIRYEKLTAMLVAHEAGTLDFILSCSIKLLARQKECMGAYLECLEERIKIEKIQ